MIFQINLSHITKHQIFTLYNESYETTPNSVV